MERNTPEFAELYLAIATDAEGNGESIRFRMTDTTHDLLAWEEGTEDVFEVLRWELDMDALRAMREAGL